MRHRLSDAWSTAKRWGSTDRGRLVAILTPPSAASGAGALLASGRVQSARRPVSELPEPVKFT